MTGMSLTGKVSILIESVSMSNIVVLSIFFVNFLFESINKEAK